MSYPPFVTYKSEAEYRKHFEQDYCSGTISTFDGIQVRFRKSDFDHCFFESFLAKDDTFSIRRAERIDWIKAVLEDRSAKLYVGWDKKKKRLDKKRRVAIVEDDYIVIVALTRKGNARFVTAFVSDPVRASTR